VKNGPSPVFLPRVSPLLLQVVENCPISTEYKKMNAIECEAALAKATKRGNASILLLATSDHDMFVWQRKTPGYPYERMVDGLCLFGGNKETEDVSALQTLLRELREELHASWCEEIEATIKPFQR
jgi:NUDIX domain